MLQVFYASLQSIEPLIKQFDLLTLIRLSQLPLKSQYKILSYHQYSDQVKSFISEFFKYQVLAYILHLNCQELQIKEDEYKRPYLAKIPLDFFDFNISHSKDYVVMVASNTVKVGIDIEYINPMLNYTELKPLVFSLFEQAYINNVTEFINLWAKKEALIKVVGKGFLDDMYKTTNLTPNETQIYVYDSNYYQFQPLIIDKAYKAYICYKCISPLPLSLICLKPLNIMNYLKIN